MTWIAFAQRIKQTDRHITYRMNVDAHPDMAETVVIPFDTPCACRSVENGVSLKRTSYGLLRQIFHELNASGTWPEQVHYTG